VLEARGWRDAVTSFLAFDVLAVDGREVIREPWEDHRECLVDIGAALDSQRIAILAVGRCRGVFMRKLVVTVLVALEPPHAGELRSTALGCAARCRTTPRNENPGVGSSCSDMVPYAIIRRPAALPPGRVPERSRRSAPTLECQSSGPTQMRGTQGAAAPVRICACH
jgi:hypothetical protein